MSTNWRESGEYTLTAVVWWGCAMSYLADSFVKASTPTRRLAPLTMTSRPAMSGAMVIGGCLGSNASSMAPLLAVGTSGGRSDSSALRIGGGAIEASTCLGSTSLFLWTLSCLERCHERW